MVWVILACVFTLDSSRAETLGNQINADLVGRLTPQFVAFADEVETQIASSLANGDYPYLLRYHIGALLFLAARDLDVKIAAGPRRGGRRQRDQEYRSPVDHLPPAR